MTTSEMVQNVIYFKRFRMESDLRELNASRKDLPEGYFFVPWDEGLLSQHAEVKFQCFVDEIDSRVFPSLGSRPGCARLMKEIRKKPEFCPEATWLIATRAEVCGTIQGIRESSGWGAIQNVGIIRAHRGKGLGKALLLQALHGFRSREVHRVHLEVTAENEGAIRLYRSLGFRCRKTIYKAVDALAFMELGTQQPDWFL